MTNSHNNSPSNSLDKVSLEGVYANIEGEIGFLLGWEGDKGFGEIRFIQDRDGVIECDSECMSKEFVLSVFEKFLSNAVLWK